MWVYIAMRAVYVLSTLVLNSRDQQGIYGFLKNASSYIAIENNLTTIFPS